MRQARKSLLVLVLLSMVVSTASLRGARRREPLTDAEADQLRNAAMEPGKRLKLYIKFAGARLLAIDQLRSNTKFAAGRGQRIHDLLEDFTAILDEINDNLDAYEGRPLSKDNLKELQKGLQEVIEAGDKFDLKLRTLKSATETDPQSKAEAADFQFVLQDAEEALKSSVDMAREYLSEKDSHSPKTK